MTTENQAPEGGRAAFEAWAKRYEDCDWYSADDKACDWVVWQAALAAQPQTGLHAAARNVITQRERYGWSPEADQAIYALADVLKGSPAPAEGDAPDEMPAFEAAMVGKLYGDSQTANAHGWFKLGWNAAFAIAHVHVQPKGTAGQSEALRLADLIDPFTRKAAPDHLTSKVAADELRRLAAIQAPAPAPVPVKWWNGCDRSVPEALRYLSRNPRPVGGSQDFNAEHLLQLAREIERMAAMKLYAAPVCQAPAVGAGWDASQIKQPGWNHVQQAFIDGAREARANADASDEDFGRASDGYTKRVFEEVDPTSEASLRTESWAEVGDEPACWVDGGDLEQLTKLGMGGVLGWADDGGDPRRVPLYTRPSAAIGGAS